MEQLKKGFENDSDFFQTNRMQENGSLLQKSIPTVSGKIEDVVVKQVKKEIPAEVIAFKKKVEEIFIELNSIIKDITTSYENPEKCADLLKYYKDFKQEFTWKINDIINYPKSNNEIREVEEGDYEKSRINTNKIK